MVVGLTQNSSTCCFFEVTEKVSFAWQKKILHSNVSPECDLYERYQKRNFTITFSTHKMIFITPNFIHSFSSFSFHSLRWYTCGFYTHDEMNKKLKTIQVHSFSSLASIWFPFLLWEMPVMHLTWARCFFFLTNWH